MATLWHARQGMDKSDTPNGNDRADIVLGGGTYRLYGGSGDDTLKVAAGVELFVEETSELDGPGMELLGEHLRRAADSGTPPRRNPPFASVVPIHLQPILRRSRTAGKK